MKIRLCYDHDLTDNGPRYFFYGVRADDPQSDPVWLLLDAPTLDAHSMAAIIHQAMMVWGPNVLLDWSDYQRWLNPGTFRAAIAKHYAELRESIGEELPRA